METLLVLPLYLIMIAGLFYLGELCLIRLTLTGGEQLRLWEQGNRYGLTPTANKEIFWFLPYQSNTFSATGAVNNFKDSYNSSPAANGWGKIQNGYSNINHLRSEWSNGVVNFFMNDFGDNSDTTNTTIRSRVKTNGQPQPSTALFKINSNNRVEKAPYQNNNEWHAIYSSSWGDFIKPANVGNIYVFREYERNNIYVKWSTKK
ncbi:MAG: hypothetical protein RR060_02470 [Victivallaceae bacterium]